VSDERRREPLTYTEAEWASLLRQLEARTNVEARLARLEAWLRGNGRNTESADDDSPQPAAAAVKGDDT
jgi:hypothetical protein